MLGVLLFLVFVLSVLLTLGFIIGLIIIVIETISRLWPNYIEPWFDKHFGPRDWDW